MESMDRILGKLEANDRSFHDRLDRFEGNSERRFREMAEKIDSLQQFRWKTVGACGVVAMIVSIAVELVRTG